MESYNNLPAENSSNTRKRAFDKLIRGREYLGQLQAILQNPPSSVKVAENLVVKVLGTLNETLSTLMNSREADDVLHEPCGILDTPKSEDSTESCKTSEFKDRRGQYKRRRTSETWKNVTSNLIDDGHMWRKYGQKVINHTKHPRNYFRCTHKFDQECKATKQVQMIQDDPTKYLTTYYGHHTCKNLDKPSQIILDSAPEDVKDSSILLSFGSVKQSVPFPLQFLSPKQELDELEIQDLSNKKALSFDYFIQKDVTDYKTSEVIMAAELSSGSDHGDVISSGVNSSMLISSSFDMDMMAEPIDFSDFLFIS